MKVNYNWKFCESSNYINCIIYYDEEIKYIYDEYFIGNEKKFKRIPKIHSPWPNVKSSYSSKRRKFLITQNIKWLPWQFEIKQR